MCLNSARWAATSVDSDQMLHSVASDQGYTGCSDPSVQIYSVNTVAKSSKFSST